MKKRIFALLLALCMTVSLLPASALAAEPFSDVSAEDWFYADVLYASENGLMQGVGDGKFAPDATTTRAMIVTVLHRVAGEPEAAKATAFADVSADAWYAAAVAWAAEQGVVLGKDAETFAPDEPITREQFAAILYRYAEKSGMDVSSKADLTKFADADSVSDYARDALTWANAAGLINGVSSTQLDPAGNATRAQAAAILHRFDLMQQATKPGKVTLTVDTKDAVVIEPKQIFIGTYTVEADQIDRIDWVQHSDNDAYDATTGTAMIDQTKGTWEAADILLAPEANTITFTAYTKNGATATVSVEITYDSGAIAEYAESDITYTDESGNGYVNNTILVILDIDGTEDEKDAAISAVCEAVGGKLVGQLNGCAMYQIRVPRGNLEALEALCEKAEAASALVLSASVDRVYPAPSVPRITGVMPDGTEVESDAGVFSVPERDPVYPNDTWDNSLWNSSDPTAIWDMDDPQGSNWWAEAIRAPGAWAYSEYFNTIRVGVADTGVSTSHEDLTITKTLSRNNTARAHGTHVAGLMGATANNNKGMTGVVWKNEIYNYDLYNGTSSMSYVTEGITSLIQNNCKVINMSIGRVYTSPSQFSSMTSEGSEFATLVNNQAKNYDFLIFQSAGNGFDSPSSGTTDYSAYGFDSIYNGDFCSVTNESAKEHIVVVACAMQPQYSNDTAHPNDYHLTRWSCFGNQVTLASPGLYVYSTVYYDTGSSSLEGYKKNTNGYVDMSGTSMASPIAAGSGALVWSVNPDFEAKEVKEILVSTAGVCYRNENNATSTRVGNYNVGYDSRETYPFVNVEAAVEEALERTYGDGTLAVSFVNAANNEPVNNVSYEIRLGSPTGTVVASGTANGSANITLPRAQGTDYHQAQYYLVATGNFTAYTSTAFTIDVGGTTRLTAALNVPEAPQAQSYRIVLTWNAEPADLDAHLVAGSGGHVYYKNRSIEGASMDLDDTQSYGPETMTVTDVSALGGFTYSVHDFTNRATFSDAAGLKGSGATVRVYTGSTLVKTYTVPENMYGTVWNVFSVDAEGNITDGGGFAYSGNGAAIAVLFPAQQSGATPAALPSETVWRKVDAEK